MNETQVFNADGTLKRNVVPEPFKHGKPKLFSNSTGDGNHQCHCGFRVRGDGHDEGVHHNRQTGSVRHAARR